MYRCVHFYYVLRIHLRIPNWNTRCYEISLIVITFISAHVLQEKVGMNPIWWLQVSIFINYLA